MTFCVFLVVCYVFSCFLTCFVTMCWLSKRWANLQTHVKPCSNNTTPNTVSARCSKLTISVTFDDFYRTNQTFWCSIVGVFLIETHKNTQFIKLFSKRFCIEFFFTFKNKIVIFMMDYTCVLNILYFYF